MAKRDRLVEELSDRYRIERELGRGGMAVVYLAQDESLDREVAIKVMRTSPDSAEDTLPRLLREARTVGRLQHPNIVQIYDIRTLEEDGLALIMRYIPGRNLKDVIREEGPFSPERAREVLVDIADALEYAHGRRLVHRDVKPENIHIHEETGMAMLSDFGIAREWGASSTLTMQGAALGTPAYMSPEQIDGLELDGRTDLYSLGLVGYEMFSGTAPFAGDTLFRVLERQRRELPPPLSTVRDDIPEDLAEAIEIATLKDRNERWESAGQFAAVIRDAPLTTPRPADTVTPRPAPSPGADEASATLVFRRGGQNLVSDNDNEAPAQTEPPPRRAKTSRTPFQSDRRRVFTSGAPTPTPAGSRKRATPRPALSELAAAATKAPRQAKASPPEPTRVATKEQQLSDLKSFVAVESDVDFQNVMDLDPFLHCWEGTVRLIHLKCGGKLDIEPPQFEIARRGKLRPAPSAPDDEVWLVCAGCEDRTEGIPRREMETALKKFLSRPTPSALETYPLGRQGETGSSGLGAPETTPPAGSP